MFVMVESTRSIASARRTTMRVNHTPLVVRVGVG
jgi:hypothetical protein